MAKAALTSDTPFARNYAREVLLVERGRGSTLWDSNGTAYLDFGSGIAVNALGYGDRRLARAVARQMRRLVHISNLYATPPALELGRRLLESTAGVGRTPMGGVHFGNSGAEANEAAIKYARLYAHATRGPGHHRIVSLSDGFHGRTMGALSATPKQAYRTPFEPLVPGFETIDFADPVALESMSGPETAAIIVEVVQGEGGLRRLSDEMVQVLNRITERGAAGDAVPLVIADEIQTGFGRLGTLYGSETAGLRPDIICLSKPLAGGLPMSATLIPERVNEQVKPGDHGTTFGGGPAVSAAALYVLERIADEGFLRQVRRRAEELEAGLQRLAGRFGWITELRGAGLLRGLRIDLGADQDELYPQILGLARDHGLLILRSGSDVIRIAPPLVISSRDLHRGLERLETAFADIDARRTR